MGLSLAWVAVEALSADDALSRLLLTETNKACSFPFIGIASLSLPNDWFMIAASRCDHRIISESSLTVLSKNCRAVSCSVEEHVNFSSTELWENGERIWHVEHAGEVDEHNISFQGKIPQRFHELLATVEPDDSDNLNGHYHMDIPLIIASEISGFRHDAGDVNFDFLEIAECYVARNAEIKTKKSWWKW